MGIINFLLGGDNGPEEDNEDENEVPVGTVTQNEVSVEKIRGEWRKFKNQGWNPDVAYVGDYVYTSMVKADPTSTSYQLRMLGMEIVDVWWLDSNEVMLVDTGNHEEAMIMDIHTPYYYDCDRVKRFTA